MLNLSKYTRGNPQEQEQFSQDLLSSLQAFGFVKIINHGFEPDYIDKLMSWVGRPALIRSNGNFDLSIFCLFKNHRFFKLDSSTKASIRNQKGVNPQRGYSGIGGESFKRFALDGSGDDYVDVKVR